MIPTASRKCLKRAFSFIYVVKTTPSSILWASYGGFEGPFYRGRHPWKLPINPTDLDKFFFAAISTEGCNYSAINFYDTCICTISLIQLCDKFFLATDLLGEVAEQHGADVVTIPLTEALTQSNALFKKQPNKKWRFTFNDGRVVNTPSLQRELYFGGSSGKVGEWEPQQKQHAKLWAACLANIWDHKGARQTADEYCKRVMMMLVTAPAKKILFAEPVDNEGYVGAGRAIYLAFAANNPSRAEKALNETIKSSNFPTWSKEWVTSLSQHLTFHSGVKIYPVRYDHVRPHLESLWPGTEFPKTHNELKMWNEPVNVEPEPEIEHIIIQEPTNEIKDEEAEIESVVTPSIVPVPSPHNKRGFVEILLSLIQFIFSFFTKK